MQKEERTKKYLPHLLAVGIFVVVSCLFCLPAFQGNTINQHDMFSWQYVSKESRDYYKETGENPLWLNSLFSGMPTAMVDGYSNNNWYSKLNRIIQVYTHGEPSNPAVYFIMAMVSFYILMCVLKVNFWLSIAGAVAFAFSTYNPIIISAGHTTKMVDIAYIPALLAGVILAYKGKILYGAAFTALILSFFFDAGHYQIIYYTAIVIFVIVIVALLNLIKQGKIKQWIYTSVALLFAAAIALSTTAVLILGNQEYVKYSIRGQKELDDASGKKQDVGLDKDYAFSWSNGVGETFCLLVPNLYGGSSSENIGEESAYGEKLRSYNVPYNQVASMTENAPLYWGPQPPISGPVYFGAVVCFLVVLSLLVIKSKYKWWLAGVSLFFILLSLGKHFSSFNYLMFDYFPAYNKFRAPTMALAIPSVLFPVLAIWALKEIFEDKISKDELWKKLKTSLLITGGLCVVLLIASQTTFDYRGGNDAAIEQQFGEAGPSIMQALREDRSSAAMKDSFRSLFFILAAGGIIWAFTKNKLTKKTAMIAMVLAVSIDQIPIAKRYLNESNFLDNDTYAMRFAPRPADVQILQDKDPHYRVLDLTSNPFADAFPSYFHKSIGGYHPAKIGIYQDLIEHHIGKLNAPVLNMLNTKYLIVPGANNQPAVSPNPGALGNAWFVSDIKWVSNANEEINALSGPSLNNPMDSSAGNFDPKNTVVIRENYKNDIGSVNIGKDANATISLTKYDPKEMEYQSNNNSEGFAVFSEIFYPVGWKAFVDGKETPIFRVNYALRGIKIPAGQHTIKLSFESKAYSTGEKLALAGSIALTLLILIALYKFYTERKKNMVVETGNNKPPAPSKKKR